ncbi:UNVERIFIED_ORG: hypothetical protein M2402_001652 [Rahnella aquatilis]
MSKQIVSVSDVLPYSEFAKAIGKTPAAVKGMIEAGKLPIVEMRSPNCPPRKAETAYP